jgi:hypothetical protein
MFKICSIILQNGLSVKNVHRRRDKLDVTGKLRKTGTLPAKELCSRSGASAKLLEKHRRYIIAAAEILYGDFPQLGEYLRNGKKGGRA